MARNKKRTRIIRINAPKHYNPGKGRPIEELAYISPREKRALLNNTDYKAEMTKHGILSFADDSASSMGVSRGDTSQGTVGSNSGSSKMGSSSSQSGGTKNTSGPSTGPAQGGGSTSNAGGSTSNSGKGANTGGGNPAGGGGANAGGSNAGGMMSGGARDSGSTGNKSGGGVNTGKGSNAGAGLGGGLLGANRAMESGFGPGRVSPTGTRGPGTQNSPSFTTPDRPITGSLADNPTRALLGTTQKPFQDRLSQKQYPTERVPQDENLTQVGMFDPNRPVGLPKSSSLPGISRNPFDLTAPLPARVPNYPAVDPYPGEYPGRGFVSPTATDIAAMRDRKKSPYGNEVAGPDDDPHADPMFTPPHGEYSEFQNPPGLPRTTTAQPLSALPGGPLRDDRMDPASKISTPGIMNPSRLGPPSPNVEMPDTSWEAQENVRRIAEVRSMNVMEKNKLKEHLDNQILGDPDYMATSDVWDEVDRINSLYPGRAPGILAGENFPMEKNRYAGFPDLSQTEMGPKTNKKDFAGEYGDYVSDPKTSMMPGGALPLTGQTIPKAGTKKTYDRIPAELAAAPRLPDLQQPAYANPTPVPPNWEKIVNDMTGPPKPYNPLSSIQPPRDIIARSEVPEPPAPRAPQLPNLQQPAYGNPTPVAPPAMVGQLPQPPDYTKRAITDPVALQTMRDAMYGATPEEQAEFQRQMAETEVDPAIREYTTVQPETDMTPEATQRIIERYGEDGPEIARLVNLVNSTTGKRGDDRPPRKRKFFLPNTDIPMLEA